MKNIYIPDAQDLFTYSLSFAALTGSTPVSQILRMDNDADFIWQKGSQFSFTSGTHQTFPSARQLQTCFVQIRDESTGRQLMSNPAPLGAFFGQGARPVDLILPYLFNGGAAISVTLTPSSTATATVELAFIGTKLFGGRS